MKKIAVIATGGTIAGTGAPGQASSYKAGELPVQAILESIPQIRDLAELDLITISQVDSNDIGFSQIQKIKEACEKLDADESVDGIVITHGTDTLEETSFILNVVLNVHKPVIITGAMRPATATSADGPMNLYQAVALAAKPEAAHFGVLGLFSNTIYSGRDIAKQNAMKTDAFSTTEFGTLGYMRDADAYLMQTPYRAHTCFTCLNDFPLVDMPRVAVFYVHQEADPELLQYMLDHYDGVVLAGTGAGNYPSPIQALIENYKGSAVIVRSSRLPESLVFPSPVFDPENRTIASYRLSPPKARLLLMAALKKYGPDKTEITRCFEQY